MLCVNIHIRLVYKPHYCPPAPQFTVKGTGGGSWVKFLIQTYVVALDMGGQELFTELKNLAVLPRYGSSKLAPTRAISRAYRDCIGILPKILFKPDFAEIWLVKVGPYARDFARV